MQALVLVWNALGWGVPGIQERKTIWPVGVSWGFYLEPWTADTGKLWSSSLLDHLSLLFGCRYLVILIIRISVAIKARLA